MKLSRPVFAALAALLAAPALAQITYPVDVAGTAARWTIWDTETEQPLHEHRNWPRADGGEIVGLDPRYVYLLEVPRVEPPELDTRFWTLACSGRVPDFAAATIGVTCAPEVRDASALKSAVENIAQGRIQAAIDAYGLRDPADQLRALSLLQRARDGYVLSEAQDEWLRGVGIVGIEYIDAVRAVQDSLGVWIDEHPGAVPDTGDAAWPPLPETE
jgi:hypothetical protein